MQRRALAYHSARAYYRQKLAATEQHINLHVPISPSASPHVPCAQMNVRRSHRRSEEARALDDVGVAVRKVPADDLGILRAADDAARIELQLEHTRVRLAGRDQGRRRHDAGGRGDVWYERGADARQGCVERIGREGRGRCDDMGLREVDGGSGRVEWHRRWVRSRGRGRREGREGDEGGGASVGGGGGSLLVEGGDSRESVLEADGAGVDGVGKVRWVGEVGVHGLHDLRRGLAGDVELWLRGGSGEGGGGDRGSGSGGRGATARATGSGGQDLRVMIVSMGGEGGGLGMQGGLVGTTGGLELGIVSLSGEFGVSVNRATSGAEGIGLLERVRRYPATIGFTLPDDDGLVVRPGHDTGPRAASTTRREGGTRGDDVVEIARGRMHGAITVHGFCKSLKLLCVKMRAVSPISFSCYFFKGSRRVGKGSVDGADQLRMSSETSNFGARDGIKYSNSVVTAAADNPLAIELDARDAFGVAFAQGRAFARVNVPDLDVSVS